MLDAETKRQYKELKDKAVATGRSKGNSIKRYTNKYVQAFLVTTIFFARVLNLQ